MSDESSSGGTNQPQQHHENPPDLYEVRITGSRETIAKVLREFELDVGCRHPHVEPNPDRSTTLLAYATDERLRELQAAGYTIEKGENVSALGRQRQAEVGKGDRFEGGRRAPSGLGEKGSRGGKGG
jgi:hypothetical protein